MTGRAELQLVLHGAIVLLLGYLCGFPLYSGIVENSGNADVHFWRVAHSGLVAGGVWSIATGAVVRHLSLSVRGISALVWSVVLANYGFLLNGVVGAAAAGSDGAVDSLHWWALSTFALASLASVLAAGLTILGAFFALRARSSGNET
jgi:hypothetical protein